MVFSSVEFLFLFLPVSLALYFIAPAIMRNLALLLLSLLFYVWGQGYITLMLIGVVVWSYFTAILVERIEDPKQKRLTLGIGIAGTLLPLAYYKYSAFFVQDILMQEAPDHLRTLILPAGISFFTFQAISYLVDCYRGAAVVEKSVIRLGTYIAMFPQLIAGPIVRFSSVARQLKRRVVQLRDLWWGSVIFSIGLAQKVLIADVVAPLADTAFGASMGELSSPDLILGAIAYSIQIYFDFSGYSTMAIGLGVILGFRFPRNFRFPYGSTSITEFWRRWHMSLSSWFRDYVYIPLGGNRGGAMRTYLNLWIVFFLTGLWHGASWNFIFWGLFHGAFLVIERAGLGNALARTVVTRHIYVLVVVMIGWIYFRAPDLASANSYIFGMFTRWGGEGYSSLYVSTETLISLIAGLVLAVSIIPRLLSRWALLPLDDGRIPISMNDRKVWVTTAIALVLFILSATRVLSGSYSPFIYFQF